MTGDEFYEILLRFHREVVRPDLIAIFEDRGGSLRSEFDLLRNDMRNGFVEIHRRLDRVEAASHALKAALEHFVERLPN